MITVTFHISCKKHSLTKTRDVVSVSKHNLRLFQSEEYNEEMIEVEVGSEVNVLDDVKEIYEREFSEALAEYNKGKRSDRQIHDYTEFRITDVWVQMARPGLFISSRRWMLLSL